MPVIHFERVRFRASTLEVDYFAVTPEEDEGTVAATASTAPAETLLNPFSVVATASFTGDAAVGNGGTITALATHSGTEAVV